MDAWKSGFETKRDVFEWVAQSHFFDPDNFQPEGEGFRKVKPHRKIYHEFVDWVVERKVETSKESTGMRVLRDLRVRDDALVYFNQKQAFDEISREREQRIRFNEVFRSSKISEWTGLDDRRRSVKVMDAVKEHSGGKEGVWQLFQVEGEEGLKRTVLKANDDLEKECSDVD